MAARRQHITELGWEIRKKLAERKMTQTEFCEHHEIPVASLSKMITGQLKSGPYYTKVLEVLKIDQQAS